MARRPYRGRAPTALIALLPLALVPSLALAYVGPGAGLGVLGTLVGLVAAVVLALFGFLWYPMKRLLARRREVRVDAGTEHTPAADAPVPAHDEAVRRHGDVPAGEAAAQAETGDTLAADRPAGGARNEPLR